MKLSETIVNKYNTLLQEVMDYYNMNFKELEVIPSIELLYPSSLHWDESEAINDNMKILNTGYPYLVPFYKIFISMYSNTYQYTYICSKTFIEVNNIIKEIRKDDMEIEKRIENIKSKLVKHKLESEGHKQ